MAFDYKKEYKEFYLPSNKPEITNIPAMNYVAVRGKGNPNEEGGEYSRAVGVLYAVSYTIKMSYKRTRSIKGFFQYVVPPLEGFWWQENMGGGSYDYTKKEQFHWISLIRLPDFVTKEDFEWAVEEATKKKKIDCSVAEFFTVEEGLCVQMMHVGEYDQEPETVKKMDDFIQEYGYENEFTEVRLHHEIYLSDPRKTAKGKCKTVIRHPIKKNKENY